MSYMSFIIRVSQDYSGLEWVRYDAAFRRPAALTGNKQWSVVNSSLFAINFTGTAEAIPRCELCFVTMHRIGHFSTHCQTIRGRKRGKLESWQLLIPHVQQLWRQSPSRGVYAIGVNPRPGVPVSHSIACFQGGAKPY